MTTHTLKVVPPYFDALADGSKTFEVRRNDRGFQTGDRLNLVSYANSHQLEFPRRQLSAEVTYVYSGDPRFGDWTAGTVVLGIKITDPTPPVVGQTEEGSDR
jgi:hypothetical protein